MVNQLMPIKDGNQLASDHQILQGGVADLTDNFIVFFFRSANTYAIRSLLIVEIFYFQFFYSNGNLATYFFFAQKLFLNSTLGIHFDFQKT